MAIINYANNELLLKIVYYGPPLAGKTTNLIQLHEHTPAQAGGKGKLISLATSSDRTLFFDVIPADGPRIWKFNVKFQLYTVPGAVIYNITLQMALRGVDGIVFVADSRNESLTENTKSFINLRDNLASLRLNLADIPLVAQYNKRDLSDAAPIYQIDNLLKPLTTQNFGVALAEAYKNVGVPETFKSIRELLIRKFAEPAPSTAW